MLYINPLVIIGLLICVIDISPSVVVLASTTTSKPSPFPFVLVKGCSVLNHRVVVHFSKVFHSYTYENDSIYGYIFEKQCCRIPALPKNLITSNRLCVIEDECYRRYYGGNESFDITFQFSTQNNDDKKDALSFTVNEGCSDVYFNRAPMYSVIYDDYDESANHTNCSCIIDEWLTRNPMDVNSLTAVIIGTSSYFLAIFISFFLQVCTS